ncbi:TetR family transcriptional regulator [Aeromicrobium sp. 636]|uniref:TetR/AcrR family transcriptional regulator n=1 Tax=Aeromicrobium senzhongii TaxID=2663859 RepID=A0A8I0K1Y7_9ACTN|nr:MULTISPECIES: TetR/AcrR family transcriptional regulator [Aeromicrobium]MBC9225130.1 TetR/AcrR family transcriptional regulator [Aeromicrobium senzhongii]MCQ3997240.1 TetR family transcriptional regulator [Aeromicrobium sp. 636]
MPSKKRSDAVQNRAAILDAARDLFASEGADVPLARIAERAGVGRATLQRHFPHRHDLAAAIYLENLARVEDLAHAVADEPDAALLILNEIISFHAGSSRVLAALDADRVEEVESIRLRTRNLLSGPVAQGRRDGRLAASVDEEDLLLAIEMIVGAMTLSNHREPEELITRAMRIVRDGLAARPEASQPNLG